MRGSELFDSILLLTRTLATGAAHVGATVGESAAHATARLKGLAKLAALACGLPLILISAGAVAGWSWLIALSGLLLAPVLAMVLYGAAPIAALIEGFVTPSTTSETATAQPRTAGRRYVRIVTNILVIELFLCLLLSLVPSAVPAATLPVFALATVLLVTTNAWLFRRGVVASVVSLIFVFLALSLVFPQSSRFLMNKLRLGDLRVSTPQKVEVDLDQIHQGTVQFFLPNDEPALWFHRREDGSFEWFDKPGTHPTYGEQLLPATAQAVREQLNLLESRAEESARLRAEAAETARQQEENEQLERQQDGEARAREAAAARAHEEQARQQGEEAQARAARAARIRSYVNLSQAHRSAAVLIVDSLHRQDTEATQHLADAFGGTASFFKPAFVADGLFNEAFNGQSNSLVELRLERYPATLILGNLDLTIGISSLRNDLMRAEAVLSLRLYQPQSGFSSKTLESQGIAARFSEAEARRDATRAAVDEALAKLGK